MKAILLAGLSRYNQEWIEGVADTLKPLFAEIKIQYYAHWQTGQSMNLDQELKILSGLVKDWQDYLVFGKSIGVILALRAISERKVAPQAGLFLGAAVYMAQAEGLPIEQWLKDNQIPTLMIQNSKDPAIPAAKLWDLIKKEGGINYHFEEIPGSNHHYQDLTQIKQLMGNFLTTLRRG